MKCILAVMGLLVSVSVLADDWQFSSMNKVDTKDQYLKNLKSDRKGTTSKILNNVEESLILQTRYMDVVSKQRFINRFNQIQGTNYSLDEVERLSSLFADRKQAAFENTSKDTVVVYQFDEKEEKQEALKQQAIRQKATKQRNSEIEREGLEFIKGLNPKK